MRRGLDMEHVQGYTLRDRSNRIVYVGTSNNIRARRAEHLLDGKQFTSLKVETKPMSRKDSEAWEARRIRSYHRFTGNLPRYNKTADGKGRFPIRKSSATSSRPPAAPRKRRASQARRGTSHNRKPNQRRHASAAIMSK